MHGSSFGRCPEIKFGDDYAESELAGQVVVSGRLLMSLINKNPGHYVFPLWNSP